MGSLICFSVIGTMNSWFKFLEFTPCLKSQLWVLGLLWVRQPASSWGLQHASYQLALRENLLLLIFLPFLPPWYASLQFFLFCFLMLFWFLVVATLGLSQCSLAKKGRDIQRGYHNVSSWKVTNARPEVFESCAWGHKRLCRSSLCFYICVQICPFKFDHKFFALISG